MRIKEFSLESTVKRAIQEHIDADAVQELVLYADNTGSLYPQKEAIMKNLTRKWRKGVYDSELADKLWLYWATAAAKSYAQEFGYAFSVQDRKAAAKEFEENWRAELEAGNAMESVELNEAPIGWGRSKEIDDMEFPTIGVRSHHKDTGWDDEKVNPMDMTFAQFKGVMATEFQGIDPEQDKYYYNLWIDSLNYGGKTGRKPNWEDFLNAIRTGEI
jgi:hypothetical protein